MITYIQKTCRLATCGAKFEVDTRHTSALYCSKRCNRKAQYIRDRERVQVRSGVFDDTALLKAWPRPVWMNP